MPADTQIRLYYKGHHLEVLYRLSLSVNYIARFKGGRLW